MNDSPNTFPATELAGMPVPRMLYGRNEAAYQLCISTRALDYLIEKKELAVRRMGRKILVPHNELLKFSRKDHDAVAPDETKDQVPTEDRHDTD
jgi:hypothetical protein